MTTATATPTLISPIGLTPAQFQTLADVPLEIEWFANLTNANMRRAYRQDMADFTAFAGLRRLEAFRDVTHAHVIAWREHLVQQGLANDTIRRKLAAAYRKFKSTFDAMPPVASPQGRALEGRFLGLSGR